MRKSIAKKPPFSVQTKMPIKAISEARSFWLLWALQDNCVYLLFSFSSSLCSFKMVSPSLLSTISTSIKPPFSADITA